MNLGSGHKQTQDFFVQTLCSGNAIHVTPRGLFIFCKEAGAIQSFLTAAFDEADRLISLDSKAHFMAALYSSMLNMLTTYRKSPFDSKIESEIAQAVTSLDSNFSSLVDQGADISRLLSGHGEHCDPARVLALRCKNRACFADIQQVTKSNEAAVLQAPGLY